MTKCLNLFYALENLFDPLATTNTAALLRYLILL